MKPKKCKDCANFKTVYRILNLWIARSGGYYCTVLNTMINKTDDGCPNFKYRQAKKYDLSKERFDKAEEDVKYILKCLCGD